MKISIGDKEYELAEPSVRMVVGASRHLGGLRADTTDEEGIAKYVKNACMVLSWLIKGDGELSEDLSRAEVDDVVKALQKASELFNIPGVLSFVAIVNSFKGIMANSRP